MLMMSENCVIATFDVSVRVGSIACARTGRGARTR
eukprot:COSAG02_NODE_33298_length_502_cov_0.965261_1_plen_34_part_01